MRILVTGAAGFIGLHVAARLLKEGCVVVGVDNLNDYYDPQLKRGRLELLLPEPNFSFHKVDIADSSAVMQVFDRPFDRVIHLAAQAGVRYSLENPHAYVSSNLVGFVNILEACRHRQVPHCIYASSSSVYGANTKVPFSEDDRVDQPVSLYAATKRSNELMAHSYAHLFNLHLTGLRFFTVYGPWGRPDMAVWLFTKAILDGTPIKVFNQGHLERDFTYIDDVVEAVVKLTKLAPVEVQGDQNSTARVMNIGNHRPVLVTELIELLERQLGRAALREYLPMQPGDVPATYADISRLASVVHFAPRTSLAEGIRKFCDWYQSSIVGGGLA